MSIDINLYKKDLPDDLNLGNVIAVSYTHLRAHET